MQGLDKIYYGTIKLGVITDSGDITGNVIEKRPVPALTLSEIQRVLDQYLGEISLPAPIYSAVKHKGKPLYHYARKGIAVPEKPRKSTVYRWEALNYDPHTGEIDNRLFCSSGTYVRALAEAIGSKIGCGAMVQTLRREKIGPFSVDEAINFESLKRLKTEDIKNLLESGTMKLFQVASEMKTKF
jgi:tRNA pseudouridine55 synthase